MVRNYVALALIARVRGTYMYKINRVKKTALAMLPGSDLCEMASVSPNGRQGGLHRGIVLAGGL